MADVLDAIVVGAGEAGTSVASQAVEAGKRVALVYRGPSGGTCLNTGCLPSTFPIHRVRRPPRAHPGGFHAETGAPGAEPNPGGGHGALRVRARGRRGASRLAGGEDRHRLGHAARPPRERGARSRWALTDERVVGLAALPGHLVVIGGGYIACELGQTFRRYGSAVTIIRSRDHLVPGEEPDVSTPLERTFAAEGIGLVLGHRVARVEPVAAGVRVVARTVGGEERAVEGLHPLVAAGRRPNTDPLGLKAAGVETVERGFVAVNAYLETSAPGIWTIRDDTCPQPFTRVCQEEGKVAYANPFGGARLPTRPRLPGAPSAPLTGLPWPVAVDGLDGDRHGLPDPEPDTAYAIDTYGGTAFSAFWSTGERVFRARLEAIVAGPPGAIGEHEPRITHMLRGVGTVYEVLGDAGDTARRTVLRQAPPLYAVARLASRFGPLPPPGRGIAAATIGMLGSVVLVGGLRRRLARRAYAGRGW